MMKPTHWTSASAVVVLLALLSAAQSKDTRCVTVGTDRSCNHTICHVERQSDMMTLNWSNFQWSCHLELNVSHCEAPTAFLEQRNITKSLTNLLSLNQLIRVKGLLCNECLHCWLSRNDSMSNALSNGLQTITYNGCDGKTKQPSILLQRIWRLGYSLGCHGNNNSCINSLSMEKDVNRCYDKAGDVMIVAYVIGPVNMILNGIVLTTILVNRHLRRCVNLLLTANMAFCDAILGAYTMTIAVTIQAYEYDVFNKQAAAICPLASVLWATGQTGVILTSLVMTVERWVAVAFVLHPSKKMDVPCALKCLALCWVVCILASVFPFIVPGSYSITYMCIPVNPSSRDPLVRGYGIFMVLCGFVSYIATTVLYVKIFRCVKRSGNTVGVKREGKMAKKLAPLIISNMFFFFLPILAVIIWMLRYLFGGTSRSNVQLSLLTGPISTLLFGLNSCANPILYSFRASRFRQSLKKNLMCLWDRNGVIPIAITRTNRSATGTDG